MSYEDGKDNHVFLLIALVLMVFLVIPAVYAMYSGKVNGFLLGLAKRELSPFALVFQEPQIAISRFSSLDPASIDWPMMEKILSYAGSWLRWPLLFILAILGVISIRLNRVESLKRKFSMNTLLAHNADNFPCLKPIVGKGKELIDPCSYDKGLWQIARTPAQFAVSKGILNGPNGVPCKHEDVFENGLASRDKAAFGGCSVEEEQALRIFRKQLGNPFKGIESLSNPRKALAAAFIQYALGEKQKCMEILNAVSESYSEKEGKADCPVLETEAFHKQIQTPLSGWDTFAERKDIALHLSYELPLFMALLYEARKKGVLANSQFLWLRPIDRPLWYALNQCGGRAAWVEGLAAWSHFQAENHAGKTLAEPQIDDAVASLKRSLGQQGWLKEYFDPFEQPIDLASPQTPPQEVVSAPAEEEE